MAYSLNGAFWPKLLGGELGLDESTGRFYARATPGGGMAMPLVAEESRKITLPSSACVRTVWLAPGSTLFWDEPEVKTGPETNGWGCPARYWNWRGQGF